MNLTLHFGSRGRGVWAKSRSSDSLLLGYPTTLTSWLTLLAVSFTSVLLLLEKYTLCHLPTRVCLTKLTIYRFVSKSKSCYYILWLPLVQAVNILLQSNTESIPEKRKADDFRIIGAISSSIFLFFFFHKSKSLELGPESGSAGTGAPHCR